MNSLKSLLTNAGLGCATVLTVIGTTIQKPYLTFTGINLGISGGIASLINQKIQQQQQDIQNLVSAQNQTIKQQNCFDSQINDLETTLEYTYDNLIEQNRSINTLQTQYQHYCQEQKQLSFKVDNAQLQLSNHNKKLKKQQHNIQTQNRNQNKITSQLEKNNNKQQEFITQHSHTMGKIEAQVDKLVEIVQNHPPKLIPIAKTIRKKVKSPIIPSQPYNRVYIDHNNFYNCLKAMEIQPDYQALMIKLTAKTGTTQIKLYDGAFAQLTAYQEQKYLYLKKLGYQVFTFPIVKREQGNFKTVGDDVQLAIDMVKDVKSGDRVVLITGDGDLYPAIKEIKKCRVHVTVIAMNSSVNRDLRNLADEFISLDSIKYDIAKHTKLFA